MRKLVPTALAAALLCTGTATGAAPAAAADVAIPVLCYHVVSPTPSGRYQLDVAKFREQMQYLASNGYTTLTADEYYAVMTLQAPAPPKPVLLTFDDGTSDFVDHALPVLQQHGFDAVQFAVSDWVGTAGHLTAAQLRSLATSGIDVENHTKDHQDLSTQTYAAGFASVSTADTALREASGVDPELLAYPYGRTDADAKAAARDAGIRMAFTVAAGKTTPADDFLALNRSMIVSSETLSSFIKKVA